MKILATDNRGLPCHEFKPSTTKDPLRRAVMHVKSVESSNVLPLDFFFGISENSTISANGVKVQLTRKNVTMEDALQIDFQQCLLICIYEFGSIPEWTRDALKSPKTYPISYYMLKDY
ncbi:hypothetical protein TNCV_1857521 [Trichonephila clavipes]|nr:hypothetical protein TNCV_1857521 [Trichonephila clavipes]